jgi:hypothetical protein
VKLTLCRGFNFVFSCFQNVTGKPGSDTSTIFHRLEKVYPFPVSTNVPENASELQIADHSVSSKTTKNYGNIFFAIGIGHFTIRIFFSFSKILKQEMNENKFGNIIVN